MIGPSLDHSGYERWLFILCAQVPIANPPETGAKNRLHFSGTGFWYVCHANLEVDSSGTRNRCRIEHCLIPSPKLVCIWLKLC